MTDDQRALLSEALETSLRAALRRQPDPSAWLRQVDESVMPDLLAWIEGRRRPDGSPIADPEQAALVAEVLAEVLARLRAERDV